MEFTKETLKTAKIEDIIAYCQEHGEVKWLKEVASRMVEQPIYPKATYITRDGEVKERYDKKQEPIGTETVKIPFTMIKAEFVKKFFPELISGKKTKAKKATMWDIIAALEE